MFSVLRAPLFAAALSALAFAACTTSSETDAFDVAPGIVYDGTTHTAQSWGVCQNSSNRYVAYWGLDSTTTFWLGVSVSAPTIAEAIWSVGTNTDTEDAESPVGKASVLIFGAAGSQASTSARIRVTPFAGGDSVRIEAKGIVLQNGKLLEFNLVSAVGCQA